jgi:3-phenylpropionate/cinnamic acid dioxygenase small subunit
MAKSKLRGGKTAHRKRVASRNALIKQKKIALTNQIIASMNEQNETQN